MQQADLPRTVVRRTTFRTTTVASKGPIKPVDGGSNSQAAAAAQLRAPLGGVSSGLGGAQQAGGNGNSGRSSFIGRRPNVSVVQNIESDAASRQGGIATKPQTTTVANGNPNKVIIPRNPLGNQNGRIIAGSGGGSLLPLKPANASTRAVIQTQTTATSTAQNLRATTRGTFVIRKTATLQGKPTETPVVAANLAPPWRRPPSTRINTIARQPSSSNPQQQASNAINPSSLPSIQSSESQTNQRNDSDVFTNRAAARIIPQSSFESNSSVVASINSVGSNQRLVQQQQIRQQQQSQEQQQRREQSEIEQTRQEVERMEQAVLQAHRPSQSPPHQQHPPTPHPTIYFPTSPPPPPARQEVNPSRQQPQTVRSSGSINNPLNDSTEETRRHIDSLTRNHRMIEESTLRRQAFEDRMAQANRGARNRIREDFLELHGRPMTSSSSDSAQSVSEASEVAAAHVRAPRRPMTRRHRIDSSSSSSSSEERKDQIEPVNRGRQLGDRIEMNRMHAASMPPIRNSSQSSERDNVHRLHFNRRGGENEPSGGGLGVVSSSSQSQNEQQPQQPPLSDQGGAAQRYMIGFNVPRGQNGEQGQFRIQIPIGQLLSGQMMNPNNPRGMLDGLRQFADLMNNRLGNMQGPLRSSNIEELANMVATIRLLQGVMGGQQQRRGLTDEQVKEFPMVKLKAVDQDEICSICLEDWKVGDQAKLLGCMHRFHSPCIDSWLKEQTICPNCKQDQREFFSDKIPEHLLHKD